MIWDCVQDMLARYDKTLKKMFAWYASLPNLNGSVSWEQFKNNHKGMLSGHLILLLTDFKVTSQSSMGSTSTRLDTPAVCAEYAVVCSDILPHRVFVLLLSAVRCEAIALPSQWA